uniref:Basic leucine zipper transcriptional factor ATF-like 2 n=1 Tax=Oryzias melastigma TaxID=30732 RepID=A0A3B3BP39_ORYME
PAGPNRDSLCSQTRSTPAGGQICPKTVQKVTKRREKNRDAARKSRRKQTERADELHEELQDLERSNSAFQKEIAELKKDLIFYQMTLKRHKPYCRLTASSPSSPSTFHIWKRW